MRSILLLFFTFFALASNAQIGYQVALLNNATGEPRANETVTVTVKITDKDGGLILEQSGQSTTNDFGVLSLTVGNSDSFANADWSKLPFFIEATVGGRLIGKSQLLSVPVAEHAKHYGSLTKKILCSKIWPNEGNRSDVSYLKFHDNIVYLYLQDGTIKYKFNHYGIDGNFVIISDGYYDDGSPTSNGLYWFDRNKLIAIKPIS